MHGSHISIEKQSPANPHRFTSQSAYPKQREVKFQWEALSQKVRWQTEEGDSQHPPLVPAYVNMGIHVYTHTTH